MAARDDIDLPVPGVPVDEGARPLTALELLKEMQDERQRISHEIERMEVQERIVLGEQWRARSALEDVLPAEQDLYGDEHITENLLFPLCLTYAARVNQGRIDPRVPPFHPTVGDIAVSEASNTILDYEKQRCSEDDLIAQAAMLAQYHGDVLFLPSWDDGDGPHLVRRQKVDELGPVVDANGLPVTEEAWEFGGIVEEAVAAPDYWTSGEEDYERAEVLCIRRVISKALARRRLHTAGFFGVEPKEESYPTALDTARRGVETFELWVKPGARTKTGAIITIVDGRCTRCIPYPKGPNGELLLGGALPGACWKIAAQRGSPRGKTHVSDAIRQQRLVNVALRSIIVRSEVARASWLVVPTQVGDAMNGAKTYRVGNDGNEDVRTRLGWFEGPDIPAGLMAVYDRAKRALFDVFGVSEATTTGGDPTETKSGQQLRDATALDAQKVGPSRRNLETARKRVAKQKLQLWQAKADTARLVRVLGPDGAVQEAWFRGADLAGADAMIEIGSGIQSTRIAGMRFAEESAQAGYLNPAAAAERRETGLGTTVGEQQAAARIDAQARSAMQGQPQQPLPDVDPGVALERLAQHLAQAAVTGQGADALMALVAAYRQAQQANQQAAAQAQNNGPGRMQPAQAKPAGKPSVTKMRTEATEQPA